MENAIKRRNMKQLVQFSAIALLNMAVAVVTLNGLLFLHSEPNDIMLAVYNSVSYILAVLNSYFWNARITFKASARGTGKQRLWFLLQSLASLGINLLAFIAVNGLLAPFGLPNWIQYNASLGAAGLISSFSSFMFIKYFVFSEMNARRRNAVETTREYGGTRAGRRGDERDVHGGSSGLLE